MMWTRHRPTGRSGPSGSGARRMQRATCLPGNCPAREGGATLVPIPASSATRRAIARSAAMGPIPVLASSNPAGPGIACVKRFSSATPGEIGKPGDVRVHGRRREVDPVPSRPRTIRYSAIVSAAPPDLDVTTKSMVRRSSRPSSVAIVTGSRVSSMCSRGRPPRTGSLRSFHAEGRSAVRSAMGPSADPPVPSTATSRTPASCGWRLRCSDAAGPSHRGGRGSRPPRPGAGGWRPRAPWRNAVAAESSSWPETPPGTAGDSVRASSSRSMAGGCWTGAIRRARRDRRMPGTRRAATRPRDRRGSSHASGA